MKILLFIPLVLAEAYDDYYFRGLSEDYKTFFNLNIRNIDLI